jgi:hypothetical protein
MVSSKRNPSAGGAGARKAVLLTTANASENKPSLADLQANFVSRRFAVPVAIAAAIAAIAFENGRRT